MITEKTYIDESDWWSRHKYLSQVKIKYATSGKLHKVKRDDAFDKESIIHGAMWWVCVCLFSMSKNISAQWIFDELDMFRRWIVCNSLR